MKTVILVFAFLLGFPIQSFTQGNSLASTQWRLSTIQLTNGVAPVTIPVPFDTTDKSWSEQYLLQFSDRSDTAGGILGCNGFLATFQSSPDSLIITTFSLTLKGCKNFRFADTVAHRLFGNRLWYSVGRRSLQLSYNNGEKIWNFVPYNAVATTVQETRKVSALRPVSALCIVPQPANEIGTIEYLLGSSGFVSVSIIANTGKTLYEQSIGFQKQGLNAVTIPTQSLAIGLYWVSVSVNGYSTQHKLFVSH